VHTRHSAPKQAEGCFKLVEASDGRTGREIKQEPQKSTAPTTASICFSWTAQFQTLFGPEDDSLKLGAWATQSCSILPSRCSQALWAHVLQTGTPHDMKVWVKTFTE